MNHSQVAKFAPRRSLLPAMLLATLMALTACGGEGTVMKINLAPPEGTGTPADGITAVNIAVEVKKDGELQNEGTISFSTDLGTFDNSDLENPVRKTSVELEMGQASAQLYSVQAGTATVRVEYTDAETGLVDASTELSVLFNYALVPVETEPKPATIEFISADPETIKIFNTSSEGQTSTKITFQVLDKLNLPIANQQIYFSIPKPLGEATLVPTEIKSDVNGYAVTYLTSGRVAGVAEVVASTAPYKEDNTELDDSFVAGTAKIHVIAGSANYHNFSYGCEYKAIGGYDFYGDQMECTAFVADRDTQEIPNQPVLFAAEAGAVLPLIYTGSNGQAVTTYTTQEPKPYPIQGGSGYLPEKFVTISDNNDPRIKFLGSFKRYDPNSDSDVFLSTRSLAPSQGEVEYTELDYYHNLEVGSYHSTAHAGLKDRNPRDSMVTTIAITGGEEPLIHDVNQNGLCDAEDNDSFLSLGEPFIDRDDNGVYDHGEYFLDSDNDGKWTPPFGATNQNVPFLASMDCTQWRKNTQIWKQTHFTWTEREEAFKGFMFVSTTSDIKPTSELDEGTLLNFPDSVVFGLYQGVDLDVYILDKYLNPLASRDGDTLTCSMEGQVDIQVSPASIPLENHYGPASAGSISIAGVPADPTAPKCGEGIISCSATYSLGSVGEPRTTSLKIKAILQCN